MNFHNINSIVYEDFRFKFLGDLEGVKHAPYLDTKFIPSIGIGFNLTVDRVLSVFLENSMLVQSSLVEHYADELGVVVADFTGPEFIE